ncbi:glucosamine-6-phosphate deaminase [Actinoplanes tereljensis]|uniref:Glucosamine-6-phosphate deaminase n=1 Tax=Paractinoplanes tereljensis TaxID=571912 RepID=A0A919TUI7_9ACTN|nr:6-phosphogluconolactonase [Actinoplanes tereljensis]GIF22866.1 glucosamine-6-phosphate deaminase [Actinoplanes tereljensis]
MSLQPIVLPDADAVGETVAATILDRLAAIDSRPFLLGCPSGRTPTPVYRALARHAARGVDLSRLVVVMMDDYVEPDGLRRVDPSLPYSCLGFAQREIVAPLGQEIEIWAPDPAEPERYDEAIEAAGGIDLFLLATGAGDGHIAFNQPGTPRDARTHVTLLGEATRRDNMGTFPSFTSLDMVPTHGVTVGIDTIAALSREVIMMVSGSHKNSAFQRIKAAKAYESDWPATIVVECKNPTLIADRAASEGK